MATQLRGRNGIEKGLTEGKQLNPWQPGSREVESRNKLESFQVVPQ